MKAIMFNSTYTTTKDQKRLVPWNQHNKGTSQP